MSDTKIMLAVVQATPVQSRLIVPSHQMDISAHSAFSLLAPKWVTAPMLNGINCSLLKYSTIWYDTQVMNV